MMTETEKRIALAKRQRKILKLIFDQIGQDKFNTDLPLDDVDINALKDFWVYTSGVLAVQNFENSSDEVTPETAREILSGHFRLKRLGQEEARQLRKQFGISNSKGGTRKLVDLYTIQDGTFKIENSTDSQTRQVHTNLVLDTNEIEYELDEKVVSLDGSDEDVMRLYKTIRNMLVHSIPYISEDQTQIIFVGQRFIKEENKYATEYLTVSKMWLRGFSELFADTHTKLSATDIEQRLNEFFFAQDEIVNERGLDRALNSLKEHLPPSMVENISKEMVYLVKDNIVCYDNFYGKDKGEQAKILANLLENHIAIRQKYPKTMSLPIIYKIQQLVARKLNERCEKEEVDIFDSEEFVSKDGKTIKDVIEEAQSVVAKYENMLKYGGLDKISRIRVLGEISRIKNDIKNLTELRNKMNAMFKSETLHMNLLNPEGLENLPVEVGFNVVCLAAYNAFVTSGFYEDALHNLDFKNMSPEYVNVIRKIHLDGLTYTHKPYDKIENAGWNIGNTAYLLECMRNALVHGMVSYKIPADMYDQKPTFKDAIMTFKSSHGNVLIHGSMADFFKLFTCEGFFASRREIDPELSDVQKPEKPKKTKQDNEGQRGDE